MTCSTYSVLPGTYHLVLRYSIIPPCTAPFEYVLFTPSTYSAGYVLFIPSSTHRVRTSQISMYLLHTEYRKHEQSTYLWLKVQTFVSHTSTYRYVLSTYFCAYSCHGTNFSSFRLGNGTYQNMLTLVMYLLWVPDSIARHPARPAGLLASDSA